jgi:MFS family permease
MGNAMRGILRSLPFIALTFFCWGIYGELMHNGQEGMDNSRLRPFICVGVAYFIIAVVVPVVLLNLNGEPGGWTIPGIIYSLVAGTLGAVGAFGIILALSNRGSPVYVMPLVFGGAPVVNTFVTMAMSHTYRNANWLFFVCVGLVAVGAAAVLVAKPTRENILIIDNDDGSIEIEQRTASAKSSQRWRADNLHDLETNPELSVARKLYHSKKPLTLAERIAVVLSVLLTAVCWGSYGPILHKGQAKMAGSRLRPFLCVGIAYFAVAVVLPLFLLAAWKEPGEWFSNGNPAGLFWSLGAGAAGAVGALGIIMAFNFGGRPIFVMPLVFGCAPIVNTFTTITSNGMWREVGGDFVVALCTVILGAIGVLLFAPKADPHKKHDDPGGKPAPRVDVLSEDSVLAGSKAVENRDDQSTKSESTKGDAAIDQPAPSGRSGNPEA